MAYIRNYWAGLAVLLIIGAGIYFRSTFYGSLYLSVAMPDTQSYLASSVSTISLPTALEGRRLLTTNLLFKLAESSGKCEISAMSNPYEGVEITRVFQICFTRIVLLQNLLSILGWSFLAWATARRLKHPLYKIAIAILILAFGFTPQIAEWDSILSSESLSNSLLPLVLGILQEVAFGITNRSDKHAPLMNQILIPLWLVVFTLWVFVRDVQLYATVVTLLLSVPFLLVRTIRQTRIISISMILLLGLFILGYTTSHRSPRWQPSLIHALDAYIFSYPSRVEIFTNWGMPEDRSSSEYAVWFNDHATTSYGKFLILHPGFVITTMQERFAYFRSDFVQPYFKAAEVKHRDILLIIGEIVHPETNAIYVLDFLLLVSLCITAVKQRDSRTVAWAWLAGWLFTYSASTLFLSFFGDIDGTRRHIFPSVEAFRLFCWIYLIAHMDLLADKSSTE